MGKGEKQVKMQSAKGKSMNPRNLLSVVAINAGVLAFYF
jgi:hypothetical protein